MMGLVVWDVDAMMVLVMVVVMMVLGRIQMAMVMVVHITNRQRRNRTDGQLEDAARCGLANTDDLGFHSCSPLGIPRGPANPYQEISPIRVTEGTLLDVRCFKLVDNWCEDKRGQINSAWTGRTTFYSHKVTKKERQLLNLSANMESKVVDVAGTRGCNGYRSLMEVELESQGDVETSLRGRAFGNGIPQATWDNGKLISSRGEWADACDDDGDAT